MPIDKNTAMDIAYAWREIETATNLLDEITKQMGRASHETVDIRDAFGRRRGGLQLGVPTGESGHRLYDVPWSICKPILELHIANQRAVVEALSQKAVIEARGATDPALDVARAMAREAEARVAAQAGDQP